MAAEDLATRRQVLKRFIWFAAHSSAVNHVNQVRTHVLLEALLATIIRCVRLGNN